ncbi:YifB family Mg chelatase-like AAA ATPase, partial [Craterilacuibacter sp.]|uniref:YifB family Mg chelatase-like AAA ATPase n=1 Tax=Craterilacuibacter sp. TaxID=2870909 RepID=UPI003F3C51A9
LEVAALQSLGSSGFVADSWGQRPFRAPHHSASAVAMVGGGSDPHPGEISLAHRGVLFLDELPEFDRRVLESLREPLESGEVRISRAARQVTFPAAFQLIAAMNPCPCGYLGHPQRACRCTPEQISRYRGKISGPLLDRIDLLLEVPPLPAADLQCAAAGEGSAVVAARVQLARERQMARQGKMNAALTAAEVGIFCVADTAALAVLETVVNRMALSARAYHRILKVARTLADRDAVPGIGRAHVLLALQMRRALGDGAV